MDKLREDFLRHMLHSIVDVEGSIVECGVFYGNSLSCLASWSIKLGRPREVWGYDAFGLDLSFMGTPCVTPAPDIQVVLDNLTHAGWDTMKDIHLVQGLFADTLVKCPPPVPIALLHIDADLYESYKNVLNILWDKVAVGGIAICDEYLSKKWVGAKTAVDEFLLGRCDARLTLDNRAYLRKQCQEQ